MIDLLNNYSKVFEIVTHNNTSRYSKHKLNYHIDFLCLMFCFCLFVMFFCCVLFVSCYLLNNSGP